MRIDHLAPRLTEARLVLLVCVVLFIAATVRHWSPGPTPPFHSPWFETLNVGRALHEAGDWAHPFKTRDTGPTAHLAPLFPIVTAALLRDDPSDPILYHRLVVLETLAIAGLCGLLPLVARAAGMRWHTGAWAGAAMAIVPAGRSPAWESYFAATLLALLTVASLHWWRNRRGWSSTATAVAAWSAALHTNANALLVFFVLALCAVATRRPLRPLLVLVALCCATLTPWMLRNVRALGGIVPVRSNLGIELYVSNNPCAGATFSSNVESGCFAARHPNESESESRRLAQFGELAYNRERASDAARWIRDNPVNFIELVSARAWLFWMPRVNETDAYLPYAPDPYYLMALRMATVMSTLGLWWLWRIDKASAAWFGVWLLCFPLIHYVIQADFRYRSPIAWMSFLLAAHAVTGRRRGSADSTTAPRAPAI